MIIGFDRKELPTDSQIIREIQRRNEHLMDFFYNECRKYFMSTCKNFFAREDIKDDILKVVGKDYEYYLQRYYG